MSKLKRYYTKGNIYFITVVTYKRNDLLIDNFDLLWKSFNKMTKKHNISIDSWVILPDHFHMILTPAENILNDFMHDLKLSFGSLFRKKRNKNAGRVWQSRFWDHIIRNESDLNKHIDYIHYNPVKHGLAVSPFEWEYSSIHEYKEYYPSDWGNKELLFRDEYGE